MGGGEECKKKTTIKNKRKEIVNDDMKIKHLELETIQSHLAENILDLQYKLQLYTIN